jgi:hypothetical protein
MTLGERKSDLNDEWMGWKGRVSAQICTKRMNGNCCIAMDAAFCSVGRGLLPVASMVSPHIGGELRLGARECARVRAKVGFGERERGKKFRDWQGRDMGDLRAGAHVMAIGGLWRASYLMRVFVDVDRKPAEVVTAYRTSKIEKYRRRA